MKKIALTIAIILGIAFGGYAQNRGLFNRGPETESEGWFNHRDHLNGLLDITLPNDHGEPGDIPATPLGSGALLLIGFGAAYALKKRKK